MSRIAILFNNIGPYHLARLGGAVTLARTEGSEIVPIELAREAFEYSWQTGRTDLPFQIYSAVTDRPLEQTSLPVLLQKLHQLLAEVKPDVVALAGYWHPAMQATLVWARLHGIPAILFSETNEHDADRTFWSETLKRLIIKQYHAALVGGKPQKRYLEKLGMDSAAIFTGYNVVGNQTFAPRSLRALPKPLSQPFFLAINRFVPKKNLSFLLACYADYCKQIGDQAWHLVLCGDGELRPMIEQQIIALEVQGTVHLPGFLQQRELLPYFAHAGCFVHASTQEQWGLVVNEAMAAGLPVLVSHRCGCFEDLVIEGVTGFGFEPTDRQQLTNLMIKMSSGVVDLNQMAEAALAHIQKFSPDYFARGLVDAVKYILSCR